MATKTAGEDFVTIVPVGESQATTKDPTFVTVLTVGAAEGAAEVSVHRPRGARLGLGLKFEGGSAAAEKVRRLLVQSCAEDSPAANAVTPWGKLIPGDEILAIDGVSVSELTRIDCVRRLKDSDETLKLLVRHFEQEQKLENTSHKVESKDSVSQVPQMTEIVRPTTLPPPVPPRKLGKKNSFKDKHVLQTVSEQNGVLNIDKQDITNGTSLVRKSSFDSHILRQNRENIACLKKGSPEEVRRLVRRLSDGKNMPPEAEVFIDLLSSEWERCLIIGDAESDDTGSSISTVVDKLGSMTSSVENSIPSTPIMQSKTIDIQKVLNCIENIDSNLLKDITEKRFQEIQFKSSDDSNFSNNQTNTTKGSFVTETKNHTTIEKNIGSTKKTIQNDKNNNNYVLNDKLNSNSDLFSEKLLSKSSVTEKPKPMPRSTKVERSNSERKSKLIPMIESANSETLLTPSKKNNIETWLQRSEAEMNGKNVEKYEENHGPEALPRLIDFVTKPQFKESVIEQPSPPPQPPTPLMRPTAPPPPPPVETREDGSGASLDTIGELDESLDVVDAGKPNELEKDSEKKAFERGYWDDRIHNKSDADDKSLSNDETPLPTCPRQPPDGVETPSDSIEKPPDLPTRLPPRLPSTWTSPRPRYSYTSRSQDARSEASVKDKIAMFSNDHNVSTERVDKCGTLPNRNAVTPRKSSVTYPEISSLDRRLTKSQDNLDELPRPYKHNLDRPVALGAVESSPVINNKAQGRVSYSMATVESKPLFYGSISTLASNAVPYKKSIYHSRSISDDSGKKEKDPKSHLEYLIEQRKKSMSKLRDLFIPEVQTPIVDLPEILVQDNLPTPFEFKPLHKEKNKKENSLPNGKKSTFNEIEWKANLLSNNIPKYSPAFKRKSLQVYSPVSLSKEPSPERKFNEKNGILKETNNKAKRNSMEPKNIFDRSVMTNYKCALSNPTLLYNKDFKHILNEIRDYKKQDIKVCTVTDVIDSDNDSAMSSTQSSYRSSASSPMHTLEHIESDSSRLSPRVPNYATYSTIKSEISSRPNMLSEASNDEYVKRNVCRSVSSDTNISLSSSSGSAATSGSQASCSSLESSVADSDKRKVSKSYNVDTINRRNILASAKCRSGRDAKLKSPVIETKFSHESYDKSPSPTSKTSDPFSTLTSSVSAISNKGENRRRSKVIAETDSDSDSETNIRKRKSEYKNMRLKRNSSASNKNKSNDNLESIKTDSVKSLTNGVILKPLKKTTCENEVTNNGTDKLEATGKLNAQPVLTEYESSSNVKPQPVVTKPKDEKIANNICNLKEKTDFKENPTDFVDNILKEDQQVSTLMIRLKRGSGSGVGLILAGGTDCEAKDVTIHRVLSESVAAKAGLKRGDKIRSINGCSMSGLTHAQSVSVLKDQRSEVEIEVEKATQDKTNGVECGSEKAESKVSSDSSNAKGNDKKTSRQEVSVVLEKAGGGAGLGFGLDGGKDSPCGDRPLTIKKLFAGGAAAQSGQILVGAELISAGGQSMEGFTRTQAWAALKSLPAGPVTLVLRNP